MSNQRNIQFFVQIRDPMEADPDEYYAQYSFGAIDVRAAAAAARDKFEADETIKERPTMYIVRVWATFEVEIENRRIARMNGED